MSGAFDPNAWANASSEGGGNDSEPPAPGTYEVVLDNAEAFTAKSGKDFVKLEFRVVPGQPFEGHQWTVLQGFGSPGAYNVTKSQCARLGLDFDGVTSLQDLDARLKPFVGNWYAVDVVQSKDSRYQHSTYLKDGGPLTQGQPEVPSSAADFQPAPSGGSGGDDSDDIPFAFEPVPDLADLKGTRWSA